MIYKDTASGFISFGGNVVGFFYSFIGFGDFFFLSCIRENKAGIFCWELGELSWILGGISALGRGRA